MFSLQNLRAYCGRIIFTLATLSYRRLALNFILPLCFLNLAKDLAEGKKIEIETVATITAIYLLSELAILVGELFNKKYLNNVNRDFKKELIKFLVGEKKNLNRAEEKLGAITDEWTAVFFRTLLQLLPDAAVCLAICSWFLRESFFFIFSIGLYALLNIFWRKEAPGKNGDNEKKYLTRGDPADRYMEENQFAGNADEKMNSLNDIFLADERNEKSKNKGDGENDAATANIEEKKTKIVISPKRSPLDIVRKNKKEWYFAFVNGIVFFFCDFKNFLSIEFVSLTFFTFQIMILSNIITNTHFLNVKSFSSMKEKLNSFF
ncbi:MAG: hypothetical protein LBB09_02055 [Rickettsiales bacterium]|jgi:hypothetical protein|nr:hypothetical protein [Rickettsiales bacterium]